jgi:hypothetical protein
MWGSPLALPLPSTLEYLVAPVTVPSAPEVARRMPKSTPLADEVANAATPSAFTAPVRVARIGRVALGVAECAVLICE